MKAQRLTCGFRQLRIRKAHFMEEDPRAFDAPFFSMSPAEAGVLDAQQRGLLEGAYRTFENGVLPLTWDSLRL